MQFLLICKIHSKQLIHYGYSIFEFCYFVLCWFIFFYKDSSLTLRMTPGIQEDRKGTQDDRKGGLLFQGLVGKDVGCDCRCQKDEEEAEGPVLGHEDGAVQEGEPDHGDRNDLDLQRDGLMGHEVPDIWSKSRMVHQPVIQSFMTAQEKRGSKKQQWSRRQNRQEDAENAKSKGKDTQDYQKPPHEQQSG